ncbi:MAG: UDP-N-acetylmuramoyl-L-alanyl-D-glutamate--2,6-diaminopimelate ligase [Phycisphaerales bacterium]
MEHGPGTASAARYAPDCATLSTEMDLATIFTELSIATGMDAVAESAIEITTVTEDSRAVVAGSLFIARKGARADGRAFIPAAIDAGARAILCDVDDPADRTAIPPGVAYLEAKNLASLLPKIAARFHQHPWRALNHTVGITGTNGKTTVAFLLSQLLNHAGTRCGRMGTVDIFDGETSTPASLTTMQALALTESFAHMRDVGCSVVAMEVSSHALALGRVACIDFNIAIFTNLTGDHLDFHQSMDGYADAKATLFASLDASALAIVNMDDPAAVRMLRDCSARVLRCTLDPAQLNLAECSAQVIAGTAAQPHVEFTGPWGTFAAIIALPGAHNVMNALQAVAAAHACGMSTASLADAIATVTAPPGRLQPVDPEADVSVYVDYAHTDAALENVLTAARGLVPPGRELIVVFGCGGDRDKPKRPRMAAVACRLADRIIITSDNPRSEDPEEIVRDVAAGIPEGDHHGRGRGRGGGRARMIVDRSRAIAHAVATSQSGDVIIIAGKGHETYQQFKDATIDFDDRIEAANALAQREADRVSSRSVFASSSDLAIATGGTWLRKPPAERTIAGVTIDSRSEVQGRVFVAITGAHFDGHDFVVDAAGSGAAAVVVEKPIDLMALPEETGVLFVESTRAALIDLARTHRARLRGRVIAVTGSAGKTTTRDLIHHLLQTELRGSAAVKSFNNDIGLPLTILRAGLDDAYLVLEIGTNHPGEISQLSAIARPHVAVITSIGRAHIGGFAENGTSDEACAAICQEKMSLLNWLPSDGSGVAILPFEHAEQGTAHVPAGTRVLTFGCDRRATFYISERGMHVPDGSQQDDDASCLEQWFVLNGSSHTRWTLPLLGEHNALNATAAIMVGNLFDVSTLAIRTALRRVPKPPMRMTRTAAGDDIDIWNDAYNANPEAMQAALRTFAEIAGPGSRPQQPRRRRVAILGEMLELNAHAADLHRELGGFIYDHAAQLQLSLIVFVGSPDMLISLAQGLAGGCGSVVHVESLDEAASMAGVVELLQPGDCVLLKGSRSVGLERIADAVVSRATITPARGV